MYVDSHYDQRKHDTFAAYQTDWGAWTQAQNDYYGAQKQTDAFQDALRGRQEVTDFAREGRGMDEAYRYAALRQSGANASTSARAGVQSASIAAKARLKETKMTIDASYRQFRERLNELDIPTLNLDIWYKQQQVGLAKANLALEARGPRNALQYSSAMGQLEGNGYVPASIAAIARNQPATAFSGQSGTPEALTYENLAKQYGLDGGGGAGGGQGSGVQQSDVDRENSTLDAIRMVGQRGPQGQAPGSLESLTGYDREILASGLERLGYNYDDFIQRYQRAGIGNDAGNVRAA